MSDSILKLVTLFDRVAPDPDVQRDLKAIVSDYDRWRSAHGYRSVVRDRLLRSKDKAKTAHYEFAESCLESIYNETCPDDPFDTVSPFWVVPCAARLGKLVGVSAESVLKAV